MNAPLTTERIFFSLQDTPLYFGAYLNQAQHNLFISLNDISEKTGQKLISNEDGMMNCPAVMALRSHKDGALQQAKVMEYLETHMPFLYPMYCGTLGKDEVDKKLAADPVQYAKILEDLIALLKQARNHYSHYTTAPFDLNKQEAAFKKMKPEMYTHIEFAETVNYLLAYAYNASVDTVQDRFHLDELAVSHLRPDKGEGADGTLIDNPDFHYHFTEWDKSHIMTNAGLAYLICLFLPRGEAYLFLKKIRGFKRSDASHFKASVEAYCVSSLRLPKQRLKSDTSAQGLFLDMCNELARCPRELYERLDKKAQQKFITAASLEGEEDMAGGDADDAENEEGPDNRMMRHNDRFVYFTQRYLDVANALPNLRFAVDLGIYYFSIYPTEIAGTMEIRRLTKRLLGYGRLEDFAEDKRPEAYKKLYADRPALGDDTEPYIRETYPHYNVERNIIPLYRTDTAIWPSTAVEDTQGQKHYPYRLKTENTPKPTANLSAAELSAMLFYQLLVKKSGTRENIIENLINQQITNTRKFFKGVLDGSISPVADTLIPKPAAKYTDEEYNRRFKILEGELRSRGLKAAHIPEKVLDQLLGIKPKDMAQKSRRILQEMIQEAGERVSRMEIREKKAAQSRPGKKAFRKVKVGMLADILAKDMLRMQPPGLDKDTGEPIPTSKANSTAFRLLQSRLAFFGLQRDSLPALLKEVNLLDSANPHPFLKEVGIERHEGVIDFYKAYFSQKEKYLQRCLADGKYGELPFLKHPAHDPDIKKLCGAYLNEGEHKNDHVPFNLPRGLFLDACIQWLRQHGSQQMKEALDPKNAREDANAPNAPAANIVQLIDMYFEEAYGDGAQEFYNWPRAYPAYARRHGNKLMPVPLALEARKEIAEKLKAQVQGYKAENYKQAITEEIEKVGGRLKAFTSPYDIRQHIQQQYGQWLAADSFSFRNRQGLRLQQEAKKAITAALEQAMQERDRAIGQYANFMENEKRLRLVAAQDKLLYMCVQDMLQNHVGGIEILKPEGSSPAQADTFRLRNIGPGADDGGKSILNCRPAKGISYPMEYYGTEKDEAGGKYKKIKAGQVQITDRYLKIKNAGNFRKLLRDRRLNDLFFYFAPGPQGEPTLERMLLENELKAYERARPEVLQAIADLEKEIMKYYGAEAATLFDPKKGHAHRDMLEELDKQGLFPEIGKGSLVLIRNAFMHNQFPLLRDAMDAYRLPYAEWEARNSDFAPGTEGSSEGYGIINKIGIFAQEKYEELRDKLKELPRRV